MKCPAPFGCEVLWRRVAAAFEADVELRRNGDRTYRSRSGPFDDSRRTRRARYRRIRLRYPARRRDLPPYRNARRQAAPVGTAAKPSYTPPQLAQTYQFPSNSGETQTIGLIELDGGFDASDLQVYWHTLGLKEVHVTAVAVDGAQNSPTGDAGGPDGEVMLDIEVAGAVAPGAALAVYFAPNTMQGFLDAILCAIHDKIRKPSVISISWGSAEADWNEQSLNAFNDAFHDAALLGITVCAAAGDNGSSDGINDGKPHVDFPASSPYVLACGGTSLIAKKRKDRVGDGLERREARRRDRAAASANSFRCPPTKAM